jgi:7-carboxy-7-deazaguanine synthase
MPVPATQSNGGELIEVFSSIQGEGMLVGCRQVFVRFSSCNLACAYCDTSFEQAADCRVEDAPGSGNFFSMPNPVSLEVMDNLLRNWCLEAPGVHHSISLTGGEPLVQGDLLREWLPALRRILPLHLETNGTLPDALSPLIPSLDWISMDIKLESMSGQAAPWLAHRQFLRVAREVSCCVKAVVGEETTFAEVEEAAALVQEEAPEAVLILQPVTRNGRIDLTARRMLDLQFRTARIHPNLRVIPQTHRFIGML